MTRISIITGKLIRVSWQESGYGAPREATLEVEHEDGSMTFLVVPILRLSHTIPKEELKNDPR